MEARTESTSAMEDARHVVKDQPLDDCIKIYGAYHSIRPLKISCPSERLRPLLIIRQMLPCLQWLRSYQLSFLEYDFIAGLTVGLTVIPQSIAYASIAGLPLQYGLYSSFMGAFVYAIFGSSKDVSLGPTTVMALLVAEKIGQYPAEVAPLVAVLLTFYTGCVQMTMGLFQLGFFVDFVSLSVAKAFMAAASIIIAVEQLKGLFGLHFVADSFLTVIYEIFNNIKATNYWDLILGFCCIVAITVMKCVGPKAGFVRLRWYTIAICAAGAVEGALLSKNIDVISLPADVKAGFPPVQPPPFHVGNYTSWGTFKSLGSSLVIFPLISLLELATIAKTFSQEYRYSINSSGEFRAVGIANIVSSFFSSYPVTASFSRSALNAQCGIKTPAGSIVTGALVVLATMFLTQWLHFIPKSALAAVVICAVLPNVDLSVANNMWKIRKGDLVPYVVTILACFLLGVEYGVILGIFISVGLILFPIARPTVAVYQSGQELIVTPYGNIHFPAIGYIRKLIMAHIDRSDAPGKIVIDGSHWTDLDYSVAARMKDLIKELQILGWELSFSEMSDMISGTFETSTPRRARRSGSSDSVSSTRSNP